MQKTTHANKKYLNLSGYNKRVSVFGASKHEKVKRDVISNSVLLPKCKSDYLNKKLALDLSFKTQDYTSLKHSHLNAYNDIS
jgi:hypothetical protein